MRFKAILLMAVAMAGMSLSARGQQAFYTLNLQPGYNAIANPLEVGSNTVTEIFPTLPGGSTLSKFNNASGTWEVNTYDELDARWTVNGGFIGTLRPGEGAFLFVPQAVQLTIFGEKYLKTNPPNVGFGFNLVGCASLEACRFEELMGFAPQVGDVVYQYAQALTNTPTSPATEATSVHHYLTGGWDVVPIVPPTRGVFVQVASAPRVVINPTRQQVPVGGTAQFNAQVIGGPGQTFQWRFNGLNLTGATNQILIITNALPPAAGNYSVVVMLATGSITSLTARLSLALPPFITVPPQSLTVTQGGAAVFSARAMGSAPLYYQWMKPDGTIAQPFAVDRTNFTIANAQSTNAGGYFLIVTNFAGRATSAVAMLTVLIPPRIIIPPTPQTVAPNDNVTLFVAADGTQPLTYQWLLNGNIIPNATGPSVTISAIRLDQSGTYRVIVANAAGAVLSSEATISVVGNNIALSDMFPGSVMISIPAGSLQANNFGATNEVGEPTHAGKPGGSSVWVNYFSTVPGIVTFRTRGSSFDTLLAAYVGSDAANLSEVTSDDDSGGFLSSVISFSVQPGVLYHITIDGHGGAEGKLVLDWSFEPTPEQLAVFTLQPKTQVTPEGGVATFSANARPPVDGFQWYFKGQQIPGATNQTLTITNAQFSDIGPYFVLVRVGGRQARSRIVDLELREVDGPGQPPLLRAYDKFEDMLSALAGDPPGVRFNPASQVLGYTGSQAFSTAGSGGQNGEPIHCNVVGGHSKWYAYIPPASGRLFLNTDGSNFDTLLAAYTGCCTFATLTPVTCDNNSGTNGQASSMSFNAVSNNVYFIAVDGVAGVTGAAKLNYRLLVPMQLTNVASTTNTLTFQLNATPSWPFSVQRSTNFINWTNFLTRTSSSGIYMFTDTNPPPGRYFYRSMQQP